MGEKSQEIPFSGSSAFWAGLLALAMGLGAAQAQIQRGDAGAGPSPILAAYQAGRFAEAAALGEASGVSQDLSLAARAALAGCIAGGEPCPAAIEQAQKLAQRALARDRDNVEARLQLALALGMKGRRASVQEAMAKNYALRGRTLLAEAAARAPEEAWAHALIGAWHLEVLRRGGRAGALLYGAKLETGLAAFEKARALKPDDGAIALHYAMALLELDPQRYAGAAQALLKAASAAPAPDAFAAKVRTDAQRMLETLETQGPAAAAQAAALRFDH